MQFSNEVTAARSKRSEWLVKRKKKEKQGGTLTKLSPTPRRTGLKKKEENSGSIIGDSARETVFEKSGSTAGSVDGSAN